MLENQAQFARLEHALTKQGIIERFEKESGKIKGRMMITLGSLPDGLDVGVQNTERIQIFRGTFDFFDASVNVALCTDPIEAASGIWITKQVENADAPTAEWVEFFMQTLVSHIADDGSFGVPMYSFVNDTSDFTVVPTL